MVGGVATLLTHTLYYLYCVTHEGAVDFILYIPEYMYVYTAVLLCGCEW